MMQFKEQRSMQMHNMVTRMHMNMQPICSDYADDGEDEQNDSDDNSYKA
jgi:hypothetical protein